MNLTQRIGPLPLWVWGGLAAAGVWFFFLRAKPSGQKAQQGLTQGTESAYGLGFAQGQQAALPGPTPGQPSAGGAQVTIQSPLHPVVWLHSDSKAASPVVAIIPNGTVMTSAGPAVTGDSFTDGGLTSSQWVPIRYLGGTAFAWAPEVQGTSGGGGVGGAPMRKHGIGSRSSNIWHDSHPLIGAPVKYPHYVKAVGGPRPHAHAHEIHRIARQAGVHPARIAMLNPVPTGMIRVA